MRHKLVKTDLIPGSRQFYAQMISWKVEESWILGIDGK